MQNLNTAKKDSKIYEKSSFDREFSQAPVPGLIFKTALPCVLAQLVNLLYSIVDRIFIGHIPKIGNEALAGVGICNTIIILISAFANFVGGGGAPLCSIALGRGDREKAEKFLSQGFFLLVLFTVLLTAAVGLFLDPILKVTGASDQTLPYAHIYMAIYLSGTFFVMINVGLTPFLNVQGKARQTMTSAVVGAVLNIALDPILMFGFRMGVAGAAVATVISQAISAAIVLFILFGRTTPLHIEKRRMVPESHIVMKTLGLGLSPFVMTITESLIGFVMNRELSKYGDLYVSALTIMQSAMQMVSIPLQGFGQGTSPVISYNYGHRNQERVRLAVRIVFIVMTGYNLLLFLFMILNPGLIAQIYTSDRRLIGLVSRILPVFYLGMTIFGLQRSCQNVFVAVGQARISIFIALLRKIFLLIPLVFLLSGIFGVMEVYMAEPIADGTAATICFLIFLYKFPRILKKNQK
ncbi:MAG: MATE family efflux transporter [Lachnospiraceae bacterium]|nr:MATE family efflux transporter [Lachnospiraceae bacterium]